MKEKDGMDTVRDLAEQIKGLTIRELIELNRLLRDLPGWGGTGGAGVREPRRPLTPLDAEGIALDSEKGKTDRQEAAHGTQ